MPGQILCKSLSGKTFHKNRTGGVAQGKGPEFKFQGLQKKKKLREARHCMILTWLWTKPRESREEH
jgi:hypothetical protein